MQLTPRYGGDPAIRLDGDGAGVAAPLVRQRRRLASVLATLSADRWAAPSRCERWSVQDVVAHLIGTNDFWSLSIGAGLAGEPTRLLAGFDPVATPAAMVDGQRSAPAAEILDRYAASVETLADAVGRIDDWSAAAESPAGHVSMTAVAHHALWDAWIHERDVLVPLGLEPAREDDEIAACLRYAAAVGPGLRAMAGSDRRGVLAVEATDPALSFVVDAGPTVVVRDGAVPAGAPVLRGDAVALVEGLSYRGPLQHDLGPEDRWLLAGLDEVLDLAPSAGA
jgi:uncharacterized protein (TIGR03083 family)